MKSIESVLSCFSIARRKVGPKWLESFLIICHIETGPEHQGSIFFQKLLSDINYFPILRKMQKSLHGKKADLMWLNSK